MRLAPVVLTIALGFGHFGCGDDAEARERERAKKLADDAEHHQKLMDRLDADFAARRDRLIARKAAAKTEEEKRKVQEEIDALESDAGVSPVPRPRPTTPVPTACTCLKTDPMCECL